MRTLHWGFTERDKRFTRYIRGTQPFLPIRESVPIRRFWGVGPY